MYGVKAFSASHTNPTVSRQGVTKRWEGTKLGQLTSTDQRDIPLHKAYCSANEDGGRRRKGMDTESDGLCHPKPLPLNIMEP